MIFQPARVLNCKDFVTSIFLQLFFDYRYDDKMDNELIFKPDHSVNFDWMKKKSGHGKKKK